MLALRQPWTTECAIIADMARDLTERERAVIAAMIDFAPSYFPVTPEDRARWRAQLPETLAGQHCDCGKCPTIDLTDENGISPKGSEDQHVLEATCPDGYLLLFIHDDRLSSMELAPDPDNQVLEFPPVADLTFD